jgi:hypothetical protein
MENKYDNGKDPLEAHESTVEITINNILERELEDVYTTGHLEYFGYQWEIKIFPRGCDDYETDLVGVQICNLSNRAVNAKYCITLLNQLGGDHLIFNSDQDGPGGLCRFAASGPDATYGCEDFVDHTTLKDHFSGLCVKGICKFVIWIANFSPVDLMKTPLADAILQTDGSENELVTIADFDIAKVVIPLVGPRVGDIENLQDKLQQARLAHK